MDSTLLSFFNGDRWQWRLYYWHWNISDYIWTEIQCQKQNTSKFLLTGHFSFTFTFKTVICKVCKQSNTFRKILATLSSEIHFRFSNFGFFSNFLAIFRYSPVVSLANNSFVQHFKELTSENQLSEKIAGNFCFWHWRSVQI